MVLEASGGGYMQLPVSNSEAVAVCMRLNAASTNNARRIRPASAPMKRNMSAEPHPPPGPAKRASATHIPFAKRDTSGYTGAGSFLPSRTAGIPSYNPFDDPHLYDYYERKFGTGMSGQTMRSFDRTDSDRMRLRMSDGGRMTLARRRRDTVYKVAVSTGDVKGAGTNAPVYLTLKGVFGTLLRQRLTKKSGSTKRRVAFKFSPGSTHVFSVKSAELGDLQSIVMEHNGIEEKDSWFLQCVEVLNTVTKHCWMFACNHWLSLYKEDGLITRELFGVRSTKTRYEIVVVTGDVENGGTDANVSLTIHGRTGVSPKLPLKSKKENPFGRGKSSTFVIKAPCVGPISKVRIEHDNNGRNPSWFLERLVVTDLRHPKWKYFFTCGNWFSRLHGDGAIARELKGSRDPLGIPKHTQYKFTIYTGSRRGAGTDADVFVQLHGENGHTPEHKLQSVKQAFERNSVDEFTIDSKQLGSLQRLKIWHNNKGFRAGWFLEKVIVDDLVMNRVYEFPCSKWLAEDEDDGKICRELICRSSGASGGGAGVRYEISVTTGDKSNASTSARVYCVIYGGRKGKENSGKVWLSGGTFKRSRTDIFKIDINDQLSPLTKLDIGHDNGGAGAGWYLDKVVVNCPSTGIEQTFPCCEWIATDEGDGSLEKTLYENMALRKMRSIKKIPWITSIFTSDMRNAGTNANVHLVVYGEKGKSDDIVLQNAKDNFQQGQEDTFKIDIDDVGRLSKIRIGHDNSGFAPGWHLERVRMENTHTNEEFHFQCGRWMSRDEDDFDICRELPARGPGIKRTLPICHYRAQVFTGKRRFAGTDANVFLNIFGDSSDSGERFLVRSSTNKNKFEKGNMDEFVLEAVKLGKLQKIRIGHDSSNPGSGWYLDRVVITEIEDPNNSANFECYRWFDVNEDDGNIVRELKGSTMLDKITYEISIKTGDIRGAGTDANVFLKIFGSHGDTGNLQMKTTDSSINKFERGRTDIFKIEAEDIGDLNKIRISHDGSGPGSGWFLDEVRILVPTHGKQYIFATHRWLDESEADGKLEVEMEPSMVQSVEKTIPYEVTVYTGDKSGAGTDANVFLQMYSHGGLKTEQHNLRSRSDNFERGYVDKFKINALDIGPLQKIRIGHDGEGFGAGWFLDKVLIQRHATKGSKRMRARGASPPPSGRRSRDGSRRRYSRWGELENGDEDDGSELYDDFDDSASVLSFRSGMSSSFRRRRPSFRNRRKSQLSPSQSEEKIDPDEIVTGEEEIEDYWFFCNQWFARNEGDQRIVRELLPTTEDGQKLSDLDELEYKVTVKTGDKFGAGTDANVFINIFGDEGDTGELHLMDSQTNMNKFERKSDDIFTIKAIDLGELRKLKVRHDNKGGGANWFLDYILVYDPKMKKEYFFPCQRWLATDKDDGQISRDLIPVDKSLMDKLKKGEKTAIKDEIMLEHKAATTTYHVNVVTGDKFGAGTDANVHVVLFGEHDDSGILPLKQSKTNRNKFERNQSDEFVVEVVDIGDLQKIRIGHDNFGGGAAWYLERVEVDCPTLGMKWYFPSGEWIGEGYGDGSLERDIYPQAMATEEYIPCIPYEITTFTTDKRGAGTSANVYIQIYGSESLTQQKVLCPPKERDGKFKRGKRDKFVVELEDIGDPIEKIRIGHDDTGLGSGWHLDRVEVRRLLDENRDEVEGSITYMFPCNRWLARDEEDGAIERELVASKLVEETSRADGQVKRREVDASGTLRNKRYKVSVVTGDKFGCGTDANIFLNILGDRGDTGERKLVNSETHTDKFERNNTDIFTWEAVDLGNIFKIKVRSDESGLNAAWLLNRIEILDISDGDSYVFHCERWFSSKKDDRKLERSLYVKGYEGDMSSSGTTLRSGSIGSMESMLSMRDSFSKSPRPLRKPSTIEEEPEGPTITYTVRVTTGKDKDMGTDGPIWIRMLGPKGLHTGRKFLELIQKSKFEPGSKETFSLEALDVEDVRKIEVGNEGLTPGSGWFVTEIMIAIPTRGKSYTFQCKTWLARDKLDGKTNRVFSLSKDDGSSSRTFKPLVPYELNVFTGDIEEAGTDCQVVLQAFGSQGTTQEYLLDKNGDRFERGRRDFFKIDLDDVGPLKKLRIGHQGKGDRKDWFLEKVELRNMDTLDFYLFKFNDYISKNKGQTKLLMVDLPAIVGGQEQLSRTDYKIFVKTSNVKGAGTDARVYIRLFGENGDSGDQYLKTSETFKDPFETNQLDEFTLKDLLTLGPLARCRVWHDNKGFGAAWHLEYIEVQDLKTKRKWRFDCNKWLSLSEDDKQISRDLICQQAAGEETEEKSARTSYEFDIITSDKQDAGMLHNAWIILEGKHDRSRMFLFRNSKEDKILRRGQTDNFKFKSKTVGPLHRMYLGAVEREDRSLGDARGREAKWHCYKVIVTEQKTGTKYHFPVKRWIPILPEVNQREAEEVEVDDVEEDASKALVKKMRKLENVNYEVVVYTGDVFGAGTNANVFLTIFGEHSDSGRLALKQKGRDLFERKQTDRFTLEVLDLGDLERIKIEHDNSGFRPDWYLDRVEITNQKTQRTFVFPCDQWLAEKKGDFQTYKVLSCA